ncbi:sulfite exporter TauE/SafE family protein [Leptolyngbya sp. AN03gr2]|uniref:sulfite exporter TauE/SafE family protein n=1 Tax=unclassified Leptolyngbya TaxID=2650499 RepID=UPI003D320E40
MISPPLTHAFLLFGTAFIAGGLNSVAGGGSFITFPTLIFTGMNPVVANATNNTAIWVAALSSAGAYRKDLGIPRKQLLLLCGVSLIGGMIGSIALLYTSSDVFKKLIPYLLLFATVIFVFGDSLKAWFQRGKTSSETLPLSRLMLIQFAIALYGGFFGAGIGILMLATLTFMGIKNIHSINAFKTFLGSCINGIAIVPFLFAGVISWQQVIVMSIGGSLGGYLCAHYARKLDPQLVRRFVIFVAVSMTAYFFVQN